ncbi:MAG: carbohydrate ABC transporter permease [Nitrososphaeria archaeon]
MIKGLKHKPSYNFFAILPALIVFLALLLFPLIYEFILAFQTYGGTFSLKSMTYVIFDPLYRGSLIRLIIYITIDITIKFGFGLITAVALRQVKGGKILWGVLLLPWTIPLVPALFIWYCLYHPEWGTINYILKSTGIVKMPIMFLGDPNIALYSVIWAHAWRFTPLWTTTLLAGLYGIPEEYYESAKVDGATPYKTFMKITLPMIKKFLLMNAVLSLIWTAGDFASVWILTRGGPADSTHIVGSYAYWFMLAEGNFNIAAAALVCALPLILVLMIIFMKILQWRG